MCLMLDQFLWGIRHVQYTNRGLTIIFHARFGVTTLCHAQSRWFHGDSHREFKVIQRDGQRDKERGEIIDFSGDGMFYCDTVSVRVRVINL